MKLTNNEKELFEKVKEFKKKYDNLTCDVDRIKAIAESDLEIVLTLDNDNITGCIHGFTEQTREMNDGEISDYCYIDSLDGYGRDIFCDAMGIKHDRA